MWKTWSHKKLKGGFYCRRNECIWWFFLSFFAFILNYWQVFWFGCSLSSILWYGLPFSYISILHIFLEYGRLKSFEHNMGQKITGHHFCENAGFAHLALLQVWFSICQGTVSKTQKNAIQFLLTNSGSNNKTLIW